MGKAVSRDPLAVQSASWDDRAERTGRRMLRLVEVFREVVVRNRVAPADAFASGVYCIFCSTKRGGKNRAMGYLSVL